MAMMALVVVAREVYMRHLIPQSVQRFSFSVEESAVARENANLAKVTRQHIFGVVPPVKKKVVEKPKVVEAPKTRLKLNLTGIIAGRTAEENRAMVEIKRGNTSVVKVGEEIGKTKAKLLAVHSDHILIEHRGKTEKLELVRPELSLTDLRLQSDQTISALNINVAEFEALAKVDPSDLDIEKLLPKPAPEPVQQDSQLSEGENTANNGGNSSDEENVADLTPQQISDLDAESRLQQIQELELILNSGGLEPEVIEELQSELLLLRSQ